MPAPRDTAVEAERRRLALQLLQRGVKPAAVAAQFGRTSQWAYSLRKEAERLRDAAEGDPISPRET